MSKPHDLTAEALAGFEAAPGTRAPYLYSSPCWYAFSLGAYLQSSGRVAPHAVRMSRGSKVRCGDSIYEYQHGAGREHWERIS